MTKLNSINTQAELPKNWFIASWLGLQDYSEVLKLQKQAWEETQDDGRIRLLGLEHPACITLGKRGSRKEDIKASDCSVPIFDIDRGGQATLHSPGQLVIYPIVPIRQLGLSARNFVGCLQASTLSLLRRRGIFAFTAEEAGIFCKQGKLVSIGIRVDQGTSRHGLAINVSNDLNLFNLIRPCGGTYSMARMQDIGSLSPRNWFGERAESLALDQLFLEWSQIFEVELKLALKPRSFWLS